MSSLAMPQDKKREYARKATQKRVGSTSRKPPPVEEHLEKFEVAKEIDSDTRTFLKNAMKQDRLCATLDDAEIESILNTVKFFKFDKGTPIIQEGRLGTTFFVTQTGSMEVSVKGITCNTIGAGCAFGGLALLYNCPRTATVKATADSEAETLKFLDSMSIFEGLTKKQKTCVAEATFSEVFEDKAANEAPHPDIPDPATDEQCLLARPTRADTLEEELEEEEDLHYQGGASSDYMKRWEGKWEKQEPLHRLSHFVALAVRAARDPSRVKLIPTLLSHFWSWRSGDPKEGLVATTLQWTQRNVPSGGVAIDISSRMTAVKTWLEKYLDYEAPFYKIKEARAEAETALRDIKERPKISERALSIANYLLAATSLMVMWREEYNLLETKSVRVNMEGAYEEIRETLKDLVDVFWIYRWGFIRMREDPSDNTYDGFMWFDDFLKVKRKCSVDRKYFSEFQDVVTQVLKREIFVLELAPMLKSFTTLHRLIPGREEEPPESEPFFPEKIYLGPYSGFMMGTEAWMLHQEDVDRFLYPSETETSGGSIWKAGGRTG
ncbi:unnamed protein product, partial [Symbiodinium necroappetens]